MLLLLSKIIVLAVSEDLPNSSGPPCDIDDVPVPVIQLLLASFIIQGFPQLFCLGAVSEKFHKELL